MHTHVHAIFIYTLFAQLSASFPLLFRSPADSLGSDLVPIFSGRIFIILMLFVLGLLSFPGAGTKACKINDNLFGRLVNFHLFMQFAGATVCKCGPLLCVRAFDGQ